LRRVAPRKLAAAEQKERLLQWSRADGVPDVSLFLIDCGLFANAGVNDGFCRGEICSGRPAAVFDAKDVERKRFRADGDDAVLADDAVLLAAADKFAGEEKKRALATVDENELIDAGARGVSWADDAVAASREARGALLANDDFAGGEAFFEREEAAGVRSVASDNGKTLMFS